MLRIDSFASVQLLLVCTWQNLVCCTCCTLFMLPLSQLGVILIWQSFDQLCRLHAAWFGWVIYQIYGSSPVLIWLAMPMLSAVLTWPIYGMQVTAILSFAASSSAGGVVILFQKDVLFCRRYPQLPCGKYELATAFAFLSWALSATSALIAFWLLAAFWFCVSSCDSNVYSTSFFWSSLFVAFIKDNLPYHIFSKPRSPKMEILGSCKVRGVNSY